MRKTGVCVLTVCGLFAAGTAFGQLEKSEAAKWYVSLGGGMLQYEGDEELKDSAVATIRLGYDYSDDWAFEGALHLAPRLSENMVGHEWIDANGGYHQEQLSRLDPWGTRGISSTYAVGVSLDALFHFTRWERVDPFLSLGVGAVMYGADLAGEREWPAPDTTDWGDKLDVAIRAGGGVMYHFNDEWAIRVDGRTFVAGQSGTSGTEANAIVDAGVVWTWGAHVKEDLVGVRGSLDNDRDGLLNREEVELGTDPWDPDTDNDGLLDGEEVKTYHTDPKEPDSDWDLLTDGDEVHRYETQPLIADTDKGGVCDGHEVLEDGTNPLDPSDDLVLYSLNIEFDTDKWDIKPEYFGMIDRIAKVLRRNSEATAVIEGHADKRKTSEARYNKRLSQKRAQAVLDHLVKSGIAAGRMKAVGYGFSRPIAKNDPLQGNRQNRRVDVYVRGLAGEEAAKSRAESEPAAPARPDIKPAPRPENK